MNTFASALIGIVVILGVGGLVYWQTNAAPRSAPQVTGGESAESDMTLAGVAKHNSAASCWTVINGGVYDLTSWIPRHPGGEEAIRQLCGTDGSEKFNGAHGGAALQAQALAGFKIGDVQ
jgi:cytochrome b involved in lipid metabolism